MNNSSSAQITPNTAADIQKDEYQRQALLFQQNAQLQHQQWFQYQQQLLMAYSMAQNSPIANFSQFYNPNFGNNVMGMHVGQSNFPVLQNSNINKSHNNKQHQNANYNRHQSNSNKKVAKYQLPMNTQYHCDNCERGFRDETEYKNHIAAHRKCSHCSYEAHEKVVLKHESIVHGPSR
jgi:DNA-directed RNA polymerase subunit RPC12/RpoP